MPIFALGRGLGSGEKTTGRAEKLSGRLPKKPTINFALVGVKRFRWGVALPALALVLVAVVLFGKFMVFDRLAEVAAVEAEVAAVQARIDESKANIEKYGHLNDVYAHYTYSGMTEEELNRVDRMQVLDLLERVVFPRTPAEQWQLNGNRLTLTIEGLTLQEINLTAQALLEDDLVSYCEVNTATTDPDSSRFAMEHLDPDKVSASIVVYLANPEVTQE